VYSVELRLSLHNISQGVNLSGAFMNSERDRGILSLHQDTMVLTVEADAV
jgi:hypothetical protein